MEKEIRQGVCSDGLLEGQVGITEAQRYRDGRCSRPPGNAAQENECAATCSVESSEDPGKGDGGCDRFFSDACGARRGGFVCRAGEIAKRALDSEAQVANKRTHVEKAVSSGQLRTQENSGRVEAMVGSAGNDSRLLTVGDLLSTVVDKAVKSDDAPAPVHLFDRRVLDAFPFVIPAEVKDVGARVR